MLDLPASGLAKYWLAGCLDLHHAL